MESDALFSAFTRYCYTLQIVARIRGYATTQRTHESKSESGTNPTPAPRTCESLLREFFNDQMKITNASQGFIVH